MTVFALVPGGWHGAWCWELVAAELTARGHVALPVDLPTADAAAGAAEYAAAVTRAVADQVAAGDPAAGGDRAGDPAAGPAPGAVPAAGATAGDPAAGPAAAAGAAAGDPAAGPAAAAGAAAGDFVLVGHSLGGLVLPLVPGARHTVYVAGMLPEPGRSVDDRARAGERMTRRGIGRGQTARPDGATEWDPAAAVEVLYPDSPPARAAAAAARLRPQHWRITAEPSPLTAWPATPGTYVLCREDKIIDPQWARAAAARHGLDLVELPGDHSPFLARPAELADLLLRCVA